MLDKVLYQLRDRKFLSFHCNIWQKNAGPYVYMLAIAHGEKAVRGAGGTAGGMPGQRKGLPDVRRNIENNP